jgi:hypothetical protein
MVLVSLVPDAAKECSVIAMNFEGTYHGAKV